MKQIFLQLFFIFILKNMFFLFSVVGCYINKLQFVSLIGGAGPHLGATRPRVGIC